MFSKMETKRHAPKFQKSPSYPYSRPADTICLMHKYHKIRPLGEGISELHVKIENLAVDRTDFTELINGSRSNLSVIQTRNFM